MNTTRTLLILLSITGISACSMQPQSQSQPSYEDITNSARVFAAQQQYYQQQQYSDRPQTQYVFTNRGMDMYVPIGNNTYMRID